MHGNIVKVRDDKEPLQFEKNEENKFVLRPYKDDISWCPSGKFSATDLRGRVEPWLTALFQSEHLSLLIGSGLSTAIQFKATSNANNGMGEMPFSGKYAAEITKMAKKSAEQIGRGKPNIEDGIRVANELLRGLEILGNEAEYQALKQELKDILDKFTKNVSCIEQKIAMADEEKRIEAFNSLVLFLMSFASRTGTKDRLNIFTTNYDRLIEAGADIAGLHLIDRFVGGLSPIFRASRLDIDMHYNPPGMRGEPRYLEGVARFTKLHGSIDWVSTNGNIRRIGLPFGAEYILPYLEAPGLKADFSKIMIYPNSAKDRETTEYPYTELFRDFAAALCRPNSTLVTYGYSFGDDHVNRIIRDMLTIPSTHLVIIAFDDDTGRIMKLYEEWGRSTQISLLIGQDVANIDQLIKYYLPKPAIDRNTIRMADLLRQRYEQPHNEKESGEGEKEQ